MLALALALAACGTTEAAPPSGILWDPIPELSDEFNIQHPNSRGDGIDYTKWFEDHPQWSGRPPSQFNPDNSWVEDGMLKLRGTSLVNDISEVANPDNDHWIDTAAVVSRTQATHGSYFETRVKVADISLSTAFWFRMNQFSEIDVFENMGNPGSPNANFNRSSMRFTTIKYDEEPDIVVRDVVQMVDENGAPLYSAENFITYGVWWKNPEEVRFYYNDQEVGNFHPGGMFNEGLHMIFDMEAFFWRGLPSVADLNDPTKNTAQIDWVRAYRPVSLLADFQEDGDVDSDDLLNWQSGYGLFGNATHLQGDADSDQDVDGADVLVWQRQASGDVPEISVLAVPEPAAFLLVSLGAMLLAGERRSHRSR